MQLAIWQEHLNLKNISSIDNIQQNSKFIFVVKKWINYSKIKF